MHKKWQIGAAIATVALLTVGLAGCGKKATNKSANKSAEPVPAGVYKTSTRDGQDKSGHQYWYFASNGKLYYYTAGDKPNHGKALTGSWKKSHDQRYQFLLSNADNNQSTELTASLKGKQITVSVKNKGKQLSWKTVTGSKQTNTSKAEFMKQFDTAKSSSQAENKTSESQQSASGSSASANSASSSSTGVHLTGGQSSVDYITQKRATRDGLLIVGHTVAPMVLQPMVATSRITPFGTTRATCTKSFRMVAFNHLVTN